MLPERLREAVLKYMELCGDVVAQANWSNIPRPLNLHIVAQAGPEPSAARALGEQRPACCHLTQFQLVHLGH